MRVIAHMDLDCFYAQVESRRLNLNGAEQAVAVVQWDSVIANNYKSREFGVRRGMTAKEARERCAGIRIVPVETIGEEDEADADAAADAGAHGDAAADAAGDAAGAAAAKPAGAGGGVNRARVKVSLRRYREASREVFAVLSRSGAVVERASIDEAYLDVTEEAQRLMGSELAEALLVDGHSKVVDNATDALDMCLPSTRLLLCGALFVSRVRAAVRAATGFTMSAGVSANRVLSKLASAKNKPNKQTVVPPSLAEPMMRRIPLHEVRGLGGKLGDQLLRRLCGTGVPGRWNAKDPERAMTCGDLLDRFDSAGALAAACGLAAEKAAWVLGACRGSGQDEISANLVPKSISACKSVTIEAQEDLERWLRILSAELSERIAEDSALFRRRPTTLCLTHRVSLRRDHLRHWKAGNLSELTPQRNRQAPFPQTHAAAAIAAAAGKLIAKFGPQALPCSRLALTAADMVDLPRDHVRGATIKSYFTETAAGPKPAPPPSKFETAPAPAGGATIRTYFAAETAAGPAPDPPRVSNGESAATGPPAAAAAVSNFEREGPGPAAPDSPSTTRGDSNVKSGPESPAPPTGEGSAAGGPNAARAAPKRPRPGAAPGDGAGAARDGASALLRCEKCGRHLERKAMGEHMDWHVAVQLQRELGQSRAEKRVRHGHSTISTFFRPR